MDLPLYRWAKIFAVQTVNPGNNLVKKIEKVSKRTLWGYLGDDWTPFLKITASEPKDIPKVRDEYLSYYLH